MAKKAKKKRVIRKRKKKPVLIVNFKAYEQGSGKKAVKLAKICEKVAKSTKVDIKVAVQAADIYRVSKAVSIDVYAQHIDALEAGAHTGGVTAHAIKDAGAKGTLLNHSEKHMTVDDIEDALREAKYHGLDVCICASDAEIGKALAELLPDMVAVEPPELIGGEISVSKADPELIKESVKNVLKKEPDEKVLVGAGVKNKKDVEVALKLGANGILIASHVVKAKDPAKVLKELANAMK